ncbi:peroxiredoxin Q/BCP [Haloechinothrix alba]|uniref:thioredoxin-dependent peroxiredoxin n=1 Tax=Haloechinothrix alba TaxID=664784 RepID=A0A238ZBF2_9PSEU|nr:thioredoxin-dependent thiol peroxidase [Haloechinothrix alba]SNR80855.1 peroxiredoxin Q/BCP [Haloechinothrix alba]
MADQQRLSPGDKAPDFTLPDSAGSPVTLSDYRGLPVIVYFYPRAATPGCTTQACDFRDNLALLGDSGYRVLGISPDPQDKLAAFAEAESLPFPLLSDPAKEVMAGWGAFGEKTNYGKVTQGVIRSTVVVDAGGVVAFARYNVKATGHVARLLRDLEIGA